MATRLGVPLDDPFQEFAKDSEEEKFLATRRPVLVSGIDRILSENKRRLEEYL